MPYNTIPIADVTRNGHPVPSYDDGSGKLYILRDSMGILGVVRARTWEDAYSICEDEFFPEAAETIDQIRAEYGFKREHHKVVKDLSVTVATEHTNAGERLARYPADYPNGTLGPEFLRWKTIETPDPEAWIDNELFQEAYGFRPNGPNTTDKLNHGIYAKDLNGELLDLLTPELAAELDLKLEVKPQ